MFNMAATVLSSLFVVVCPLSLPWGFAVTYKRGNSLISSIVLSTLTCPHVVSQQMFMKQPAYMSGPVPGSGDTMMDNAKSLPLGAYSLVPLIGAQ